MKRQAEEECSEIDNDMPAEINGNKETGQYCKRQKIDVHRWSLSSSTLLLDELFDSGVKLLDTGSESSDESEQRGCNEVCDFIDTSCSALTPASKEMRIALLEATLTKEALHKISEGDWSTLDTKNVRSDYYRTNPFELLSDEMVLQVFHWIPKSHLTNVALVCKRFHQLCQDKSLWSRMDVAGRTLERGALGQIMSRQILLLRLAQSEIGCPAFLPGVKATLPDFKARLLYLDLSMAEISKQCLTDLLEKCYRLKKISLEHVPVDDGVLQALSYSKDIEVINFAMVEGITTEGMKFLLNTCRKIKELNIAWTHLSNCCIKYICSNLPSTMDRLNISGCRKYMMDKNVASLVSTCPHLRELDLSDCTGLTGNSIQYISLLEDLNFLALSRCYFIPYRSLLALKTLRSLAYLDIHGGHLDGEELKIVEDHLGSKVHINKFKFSSVARPTVGPRRSSIWGQCVRD